MAVNTMWAGGVTDTVASVVAEVGPSHTCRLAVSTNSGLASPSYGGSASSDSYGFVTLASPALTAGTSWYYSVEIDGVLDPTIGHFTTFPTAASTASFTFGYSSCNQSASNHRVFDAIKARTLAFFAHIGDIHYQNIATADPLLYQDGIREVLLQTRPGAMFRQVASVYMYDDHDFGPDNSDRTSTGAATAAANYRRCAPHYTLPDASANYQAFTVGRVPFILTDLRFYRDPDATTDSSSKTMLGTAQKTWLKAQLLANKSAPVQFWLNTQCWAVDLPSSQSLDLDGDHWGAFSYEREEIADYMAANGIINVVILGGDAHMLAYKRAVDYSAAKTAPVPVLQASSLDQTPNQRGDGWDGLSLAATGHYATVAVTDSGGSTPASVTWTGWQVDGTTGVETQMLQYSFVAGVPTLNTKPSTVRSFDGSAWHLATTRETNGSAFALATDRAL